MKMKKLYSDPKQIISDEDTWGPCYGHPLDPRTQFDNISLYEAKVDIAIAAVKDDPVILEEALAEVPLSEFLDLWNAHMDDNPANSDMNILWSVQRIFDKYVIEMLTDDQAAAEYIHDQYGKRKSALSGVLNAKKDT